jgi:type IV pilus assembly protein PilC
MPTTYSYKVRDTGGRVISGSLEAENSNLVVNKLKDMGYTPISIDKKTANLSSEISIPGLSGRIKPQEIALVSRQFATLINAGVSLTRSLAILGAQNDNKRLAEVLDDVRADVEGGESLSHALGKHPKQFNRLYVSMVRAGEVGGNLDRTLNDLSTTLEKEVELKHKIKSAMTYPGVVLGMVVVIMAAMLLFVVPVFTGMYKTLGGTLPLPTRILVRISGIAVKDFPFVLVFAIIAVIGFKKWKATERGRDVWDHLILRVPIFGQLVQKTALSRFSATLSTLMASGVPVLEALDITGDTAGNTVVAAGVQAISDGARRGEPMAKSLEDHPVFPPMVTQMIAVGEETGALDQLLSKIADFYNQEVQSMVDALTSLLEPLMIVIIGSCVGATVISLYLPMFDIYKVIAKSG